MAAPDDVGKYLEDRMWVLLLNKDLDHLVEVFLSCQWDRGPTITPCKCLVEGSVRVALRIIFSRPQQGVWAVSNLAT